MRKSGRFISRILIVSAILYLLGGIILYFGQSFFLFHPIRLAQDYQFKIPGDFEEVSLHLGDNESVSIVKFKVPDSIKKGVLIYFHGNMRNVERYASLTEIFTESGYEVWMSDYPGFGKTTGELTEENLYLQSQGVFDTVSSKISADSIIIYGKSLGTGIASYIAAKNDCKMLILETPYYSMLSLFKHYAFAYPVELLIKYKIPTYEYLENVDERITIIHGTNDEVIPYKNAERLLPILKPGDEFITIEGAKHNNIPRSDIYSVTIKGLLRN